MTQIVNFCGGYISRLSNGDLEIVPELRKIFGKASRPYLGRPVVINKSDIKRLVKFLTESD